MRTVVVSHGHLDHLGGLGYWASQRFLNSMPPASLLVPSAIEEDIRSLLENFARLEGGRPYEVEVIPMEDGSVHQLRRDMELAFFATDHWVPTLGTRITWHKRRLRTEHRQLPEAEIARRQRAGEVLTEDVATDILSYCADSGPALIRDHPEIFSSEIVMLECSFFKPGDQERAARYGHTHVDDLSPISRTSPVDIWCSSTPHGDTECARSRRISMMRSDPISKANSTISTSTGTDNRMMNYEL